jgi:hypothetical protein
MSFFSIQVEAVEEKGANHQDTDPIGCRPVIPPKPTRLNLISHPYLTIDKPDEQLA